MSNYKNPFEPGGAFYNPRITDASKVIKPRIMPDWVVEKQQQSTIGTEFYDINTGKFIEQADDGETQIIFIEKAKHTEYSEKCSNYPFEFLRKPIFFTHYIIKSSENDTNFHVIKKITSKELNERAIWVYNECRGSIERINTKDVTYNIGEIVEINNMKVADIYANTINNAVETDGSWEKVKKGPRIGKNVNGKYIRTGEKLMRGEEPAGKSYSRELAKSYVAQGAIAFNKNIEACNARLAVMDSIINPIKIGGVRAWLGADYAKPYVNNPDEHYEKAILQFSFKSSNVYYHSFYKNK